MKHIRQTNANGITITAKTLSNDAEPELEEEKIGCGIYLITRLLNHSCDPNVVMSRFDGDVVVLHAIRDIEQGEELFNSYGADYRWQLLSQRQKLLKESYFFDCCCTACAAKKQPLTRAFKCPKCKGPVVADGKMTCQACKKEDHVDVQRIMDETEASLSVAKIGRDYLLKGKDDKEQLVLAEQALKEAYDGLSGVLYQTHRELNTLALTIRQVKMRLQKHEDAVFWTERILKYSRDEFGHRDYNVLNALIKLINCKKDRYLQIRSKQPLDKNKLNLLKTQLLDNLEEAEKIRGVILTPGSAAALSLDQRLSIIKKLL